MLMQQAGYPTWEGEIRLAKPWEANPRSRKTGASEPDTAP